MSAVVKIKESNCMVWCSYLSPQPYSKLYIFKQKIVTFGEIFYQ